jgi:hypothetical protein
MYDLNPAHEMDFSDNQAYATIVGAYKCSNGIVYLVDRVLAPAITPIVVAVSYHGPLQALPMPEEEEEETPEPAKPTITKPSKARVGHDEWMAHKMKEKR